MAQQPSPEELAAEAEISEATAIAKASTLIDQQETEISSARLDAVLQVIDVLVAARFVDEAADLFWLLPAMGYPVIIKFHEGGEDDSEDTDDD